MNLFNNFINNDIPIAKEDYNWVRVIRFYSGG